jgi:hypothetical protein
MPGSQGSSWPQCTSHLQTATGEPCSVRHGQQLRRRDSDQWHKQYVCGVTGLEGCSTIVVLSVTPDWNHPAAAAVAAWHVLPYLPTHQHTVINASCTPHPPAL